MYGANYRRRPTVVTSYDERREEHGNSRLVPMPSGGERPGARSAAHGCFVILFRNTRLPVATVIENLENLSVEEVMEQFDVRSRSQGHLTL